MRVKDAEKEGEGEREIKRGREIQREKKVFESR